MKTIIFTKAELDSLPKEVQEQVMYVYNNRQNDMTTLKDRGVIALAENTL